MTHKLPLAINVQARIDAMRFALFNLEEQLVERPDDGICVSDVESYMIEVRTEAYELIHMDIDDASESHGL